MVRLALNSCKLYFILVHCLYLVVAPLTIYEKAQVSCAGRPPSWDPSAFSMYNTAQSLCAKSIYGGVSTRNAGAWCGFHRSEFGVVFDEIEAHSSLITPRIHLYCLSRCRCTKKHIDGVQKLNGAREIVLYRALYYDALIFFLDLLTGLTLQIPYPESRGEDPEADLLRQIKAVPVILVSLIDALRPENGNIFQRYYIVPVAGSPMICHNLFPPMQLPQMFVGRNMQQICAARRFGGVMNQNAGGVCVQRQGAQGFEVDFMQELSTPNFYPTSFPLGVAVRTWCQSGCFCDLPEINFDSSASYVDSSTNPSDQSSQFSLSWLNGLPADSSGGGLRVGAVVLIPQGDWGHGGSQYKLTPAPYPLDKLPWPTESWRPPPAGYVEPSLPDLLADPQYNTRKILRPKPAARVYETETCSGSCQGPCGSKCSCRVMQGKEAGWNGDDPVFPPWVARCALSAVAASLLGKRGDENVLGCVCNTTYISRACCHSTDGMVWEDQQLKLGRLDVDPIEV